MAQSKEKNSELTKSKEVIESYIFSTSHRKLSIYSERLLMRIVEIAQRQIAGINFQDGGVGQVSIGPLGEARLEIPIRSLLGPGNTNYNQAKKAIMELMSCPYSVERPKIKGGEYVRDKKGNIEFEFIAHQILNDCEVNVKPGIACIVVNENTWKSVLFFGKGYRKFDLIAGLQLTKSSSARMFRLVSNQTNPISFSIAELRKMWGLEDKYPKTSDFIKRTIDEAKEELDRKAPWTFEYTTCCSLTSEVNKGRRGKKAITSVTFFPKRKITNMSTGALVRETETPVSVLGRETYDLLLNKFEFTPQGLKNNLMLFSVAKKAGMDLFDFLYQIAPNAVRATNPPGYVINSIERKLKERYGITKTPTGYVKPE